mgnify:CR=1 FL=1
MDEVKNIEQATCGFQFESLQDKEKKREQLSSKGGSRRTFEKIEKDIQDLNNNNEKFLQAIS